MQENPAIIRVTGVEIQGLKNVKKGVFQTTSTIDSYEEADIIGFYGQNGSGKTAVVDAFNILKNLLSASKERALPSIKENLIMYKEECMKLFFYFVVKNRFGEFFVNYEVSLIAGEERLQVVSEELSYKENEKNKRMKIILSKKENKLQIRNKKTKEMNEELRISVEVANRMAFGEATSFIFRKELKDALKLYLSDTEIELLRNLSTDFNRDLHIIDTVQYGLLVANIIMPFSVHFENKRGHIPYEMKETSILPAELFTTIESIVTQTNIVLKTIIPGLQIKVQKINEQKLNDGRDGIRFELLSKRGHQELPLRTESEGIVKIISILNALIAVHNNPNACIVIDELDAGIFEYLLGELLEVLDSSGQGQLIFTSHNLRILEVLPIKNMWFTTLNEDNRYMQLKGVQKFSNARDIYLRAIQLGGQNEEIYVETDSYDIKKSFRRAGLAYE